MSEINQQTPMCNLYYIRQGLSTFMHILRSYTGTVHVLRSCAYKAFGQMDKLMSIHVKQTGLFQCTLKTTLFEGVYTVTPL